MQFLITLANCGLRSFTDEGVAPMSASPSSIIWPHWIDGKKELGGRANMLSRNHFDGVLSFMQKFQFSFVTFVFQNCNIGAIML